jgi:hypothetical protein
MQPSEAVTSALREAGARDPITRLQSAIDCLPERTRRAMLEGVRADTIVVGAYTDGDGGICPMLAAHRHGGRTSFLSFARAWDGFARADKVRRATPRELRVLEGLLLRSLEEGPDGSTDLGAAIAEHRASLARRRTPEIIARRLKGGRFRSPHDRDGPRAAAGEVARTAS